MTTKSCTRALRRGWSWQNPGRRLVSERSGAASTYEPASDWPGGDREGHRWAGTAMDELVSFLSWRIRSSYRSTPDWTVYGIFTFCEGGSAMSDLVTRRTT